MKLQKDTTAQIHNGTSKRYDEPCLCQLFVYLNVVIPCMYDFKSGESSKFVMNIIINLAYIKYSHVFLLEPWQNNLGNPETSAEPCQAAKMDGLAKIVNNWKLLTFIVKHSTFDVWQSSEYVSTICYSLFGKSEDNIKIDSAAT